MSTDLILDSRSHDLGISEGAIKFFRSNIDVVAQRIKIAILTKQGEWFLNTAAGLPYYQEFFTNKNNKSTIDQTMINRIGKVEGVIKVVDYSSEIGNDRKLSIKVSVQTVEGDIVTLTLGRVNA